MIQIQNGFNIFENVIELEIGFFVQIRSQEERRGSEKVESWGDFFNEIEEYFFLLFYNFLSIYFVYL